MASLVRENGRKAPRFMLMAIPRQPRRESFRILVCHICFPPDSPADSSFTIYTLYDDNNLYVAVDVTDDIVICDGPVPYLDDDAEIMIDGDASRATSTWRSCVVPELVEGVWNLT